MVRKITLTRPVSPALDASVLGSADLALISGGTSEASTAVMKSRHDTAKNAIGNIR